MIGRLELHRRGTEFVAAHRGHQRGTVGEQFRLVRVATALENADDSPVAAADLEMPADGERRRCPLCKSSDGQLVPAFRRHPALHDADLRPQIETGRRESANENQAVRVLEHHVDEYFGRHRYVAVFFARNAGKGMQSCCVLATERTERLDNGAVPEHQCAVRLPCRGDGIGQAGREGERHDEDKDDTSDADRDHGRLAYSAGNAAQADRRDVQCLLHRRHHLPPIASVTDTRRR